MTTILLIAVGYLLGSIPFGVILTRAFGAGDLRQIGSGNIGATNVLRTGRKGLAAATLLLDGAKGAVAVLLARHFVPELGDDGAMIAGAAAMIGHCYPVWLRFRGGYNRAVRAPNLAESFQGRQNGFGVAGATAYGDPCSLRAIAPFGANPATNTGGAAKRKAASDPKAERRKPRRKGRRIALWVSLCVLVLLIVTPLVAWSNLRWYPPPCGRSDPTTWTVAVPGVANRQWLEIAASPPASNPCTYGTGWPVGTPTWTTPA